MKKYIKLILVFMLVNQVLVGQLLFDEKDYVKYNDTTYVFVRVSANTQSDDNTKILFGIYTTMSCGIKNISKDNIYIFTSTFHNFSETLDRINLRRCQVNTYYDNFHYYFPHSGIAKYNFNKIGSNDLYRINVAMGKKSTLGKHLEKCLEKCPEISLLCYFITIKNDLEFYTKMNGDYYLIPLDDINFHSATLSCEALNEIKVEH
jgi:hypothetical protein